MKNIKEYLDYASTQYYNGVPIISDEVFDRLAESIDYSSIGAKQHENVCNHVFPMWSLQKFYEGEGNRPLADTNHDYAYSLKLDGAAISLLYLDGKLSQVLTRGDGKEGRDITSKFITRKTLVPLQIDAKGVIQVTGEIVAPKHIENSRNYAAGALNLKSDEEFCTKDIYFYAYGLFPFKHKTYSEDINWLEGVGFSTIFTSALSDKYECDGTVCRIEDNAVFESLGYTAKFPRGAYAIKTRKEAVETELIGVEWAVGKSGKVTPTGILKPVYIGDKLISRVTLNNINFIEEMDLEIGCTIGVILGGEIIPRAVYKVD